MPEGDTIYRTATVLRRVLEGKRVTGFETNVPHDLAILSTQGPGTASVPQPRVPGALAPLLIKREAFGVASRKGLRYASVLPLPRFLQPPRCYGTMRSK